MIGRLPKAMFGLLLTSVLWSNPVYAEATDKPPSKVGSALTELSARLEQASSDENTSETLNEFYSGQGSSAETVNSSLPSFASPSRTEKEQRFRSKVDRFLPRFEPDGGKQSPLEQRFHHKMVVAWTGFWAIALPVYIVAYILRAHEMLNWFTLHHSNFFHGLGIMGIVHHFAASFAPRHANKIFYATLSLIALGNAMVELSPSPLRTAPSDFSDFYSGIAAVAVYAVLSKVIQKYFRAPQP